MKKKRRNPSKWHIVKNQIPFLILLLIGLFFTVTAIQDALLLCQWEERCIEYEGTFAFAEKHYYRNTNYRFSLENGEVINVYPEDLTENKIDFEKYEELKFQYASHKRCIPLGIHHPCISISTPDGEAVFMEEESSKQGFIVELVAYLLIGGIPLLISIFFLLMSIPKVEDAFWRMLFPSSRKGKKKKRDLDKKN